MWVVPGEFTKALEAVSQAFAGRTTDSPEQETEPTAYGPAQASGQPQAAVTAGSPRPDAVHDADRAAELAQAAVSDAKAEAAAAERGTSSAARPTTQD